MLKLIAAMLLLQAMMVSLGAHAQSAETVITEGQFPQAALTDGGYTYQLFIPRGYQADPDKHWPLMIFLHGSGERGNDVVKVKVHGPPKIADRQLNFPFILVSPLLPAEEDWDITKLGAILDHVQRTLSIDPARIYLTGLSRGGHAS